MERLDRVAPGRDMSEAEAARPSETGPSTQHRILAVVIAVQAGWLVYLCSRGWFYQDDFTLLSQAVHQHLTLDYLKQPYNGHFAPGVRLLYWFLAHSSRLHYGPTIVLRVVLQAIATLLLFQLLVVVTASRTCAVTITAFYSASPLLVPGTLWLASSSNLLTAQVCVLIVYLAHIRHSKTGELRWSLVAGIALVVGVGFWEKTAVTSLLLVILSLGWLTAGSLGRRVMTLLRDWRGWLLTLAPLGAFTGYYFTHNYETSSQALPAHAAVHLVWLQWSHSLWPAVIGAPWHWASGGESFAAVADPALITVILGQCAFVILVIAGWRRTRWQGLIAWTLPIVAVVVGEVLVGIGRYADFGTIPALGFSYVFDLGVPLALAVALAWNGSALSRSDLAVLVPAPTEPSSDDAADSAPTRRSRRHLVAAGLACALLVASAAVSALTWTSRWHASPAKSYVATLLSSVHSLGSSANLYDTPVSLRVLPFISPDRNLSDLLAVTSARVTFDKGLPQPQFVEDSGRVVPASFLAVAQQHVAPNAFCPTLVKGVTSVTVPLKPRVGTNAYFLQIDYFEKRPALVTIKVADRHGRRIGVRGNSTVDFGLSLGVALLPLQSGQPASVTFSSSSPSASVCMSQVKIGEPVAATP
jgi:hypothetical protein